MRRVGVALGVVVAGLLVTACTGNGGGGDGKAPGSAAASGAASGAPMDVVGWYGQGGATLVTQISGDLSKVSADSAAGRSASLPGDCQALAADVGAARNYPAIPDREAQTEWVAALDGLDGASRDCQAGRYTRSASEIQTAAGHMRQATDRVNRLVGAASSA